MVHACEELTLHLERVARLIPAPVLDVVQRTVIHLREHVSEANPPLATVHWSSQWLAEHGRGPDWVGAIEVCELAAYLDLLERWAGFLIHELGHVFHQKGIGLNTPLDDELKKLAAKAATATIASTSRAYLRPYNNDRTPCNRESLRREEPGWISLSRWACWRRGVNSHETALSCVVEFRRRAGGITAPAP